MTLTPEQRATLLGYRLALAARRAKTGSIGGLDATTAEITEQTGRVGQVVGLLCSNLVEKGLLRKTAPATYRITPAGFNAIREEEA